MSLLKRFSWAYISITIISLIILIILTNTYTKNYSEAEINRISGITDVVKKNISEALKNISAQGEDLTEWIEALIELEKIYNIDNVDHVLKIENQIKKVQADYVLITNGKTFKEHYNSNKDLNVGLEEGVNHRLENLSDSDENASGEIYASKENCYYIYSQNIELENEVKGILLIAKRLDENYFKGLGNIYARNISIVDRLEDDLIQVDNYDNKENILNYKFDGDSISSYTKINTTGYDKEYYLKVVEKRKTIQTTKELSHSLLGIFILALLSANGALYFSIKMMVVNRIVKTNNEVNNIVKNYMEFNLLTKDNYNDEISNLGYGINNMLKKIKEGENNLIWQYERNGRLLEAMSNGYIYISLIKNESGEILDGKIEEINQAAKDLYKIDSNENIVYLSEMISRVDVNIIKVIQDLREINGVGNKKVMEDINLVDDIWVNISLTCIEEDFVSVILNDVSNLKRFSKELEELLNKDDITKLNSRYFLVEKLTKLKGENEEFQLCFIDLDNFKTINDTIGHNRGDKILEITGQSLKKLEDENTIVCRVGGDEFVVLRQKPENDIECFGKEVMKHLQRRVKFNNYTYYVKGSMGICQYPTHSKDPFKILQYADVALYEAKYQGGNQFKIFNKEMMENFDMDTRLKQGIKNGEFEVYYQPVYSTETSKIIGAEALVRWNKGDEIIAPDKFIGVAKKTGDIVFIDEFVLKNACMFCKEQISNGEDDFTVSVNISYKYFTLTGFIQRLESILKEYQLPATSLKLEVTEDEVVSDYKKALIILKKVRRMGVKIALDDFGIGYSSFKYIKNLPIDVVKIDKSLIFNIEGDKKSEYIIETLINLCSYLNLDVVCEGVEQKEQLEILKNIKCTNVQGFYISKPVKKEEFIQIYNKTNR
ncbi:MAG: EAL domain-containing protein [Clostridium sp.]